MKAITFILMFAICSKSYGQNNSLNLLEIRAVNVAIQKEMAYQEVNGLAIGIVKDGRIVFTKGYGHMDAEKSIPVQTTTPFNWASVSKTLTAVAAWQLIERDMMNLNDRAKNVLGRSWVNSDPKSGDINVGHLLTHTSGICHYSCIRGKTRFPFYRNNYTDTRSDWNYVQSINVFENRPILTTPGSVFEYSSFGYNLLGAMIHVKSDIGYVQWIEKNVIERLVLNSLQIADDDWVGFQKDCNGTPRIYTERENRWRLPGGGWRSDIRDITAFMNALINNKLLNNSSQLWRSVRYGGRFNENNGYRHGLQTEYDTRKEETLVFHEGKHENVRTILAFYPKSKFGIVIMANGGYVDVKQIFNRVADGLGYERNFIDYPVSYCETLNNCDDNFIGVWQNTNIQTIVRTGYDLPMLEEEISQLKLNGYTVDDIEMFEEGRQMKIDCIFNNNRDRTEIAIGKRPVDFDDLVESNKRRKLYLHDIEVYIYNGQPFVSGVFKESSNEPKYFPNFVKKDFMAKNVELKRQGYMLNDVEIYDYLGQNRWAGIWKKGPDIAFVPGVSKDLFVKRIESESKVSRFLTDVEYIEENGRELYVGIFVKRRVGHKFRSKNDYCGLTSNLRSFASESFEIIDLERN